MSRIEEAGQYKGKNYDPKRFSPTWKAHMNSSEVVREHKRIVKFGYDYMDKKREQMDENRRRKDY